ncbi:D-alanyl-D-alanine carboxypeptidase family protein [Oribacterium parvum]|jgi:hypothetical protein|uniref:D-alanyl-D-alanine carboxypeptidase family protein n=1 Tax=Oribacterium parvum TaxID=1501329 RepID=UPI003AB9840F
MKFRDIEMNQTKESEKRKLGFAFNRKFYRAGLAVLLSLSLCLPFSAIAEERVYGISDYGPVSVNGNGVGRGNDPTYQYIEDLLYGNRANTPTVNNDTTGNSSANPQVNSSGTPSVNPGTATMTKTGSLQNLAQLSRNSSTRTLSSEIDANYAVVYDLDNGSILAEKNASQAMYPASMTKVMSLLIFAESLPDMNKKLTITQDIVSFVQARGASNCGFVVGEEVSVKDLLYGVILPSGADAVLALCREVSGSEAAFVDRMNKRAREMGLSSQCNFQNATGLFHSTHRMTVKDMAQIMAVAMQNPRAREVLMTENYQTAPTNKHPQGIKFTNLFLQRVKTQDSGGATVQMAKTGYVSQSKFCVVTAGKGRNGKNLLVVSGQSSSTWQAIKDQAALYKLFGA